MKSFGWEERSENNEEIENLHDFIHFIPFFCDFKTFHGMRQIMLSDKRLCAILLALLNEII